MTDKLYKASTILISTLAITGFAVWLTVAHEVVHWNGVEDPLQLCVGPDFENEMMGSVKYHGAVYWFGTEWFAFLTSLLLTLGTAIPTGYWVVKRHEK